MAEDPAGSAAISYRGGADWVLRRPSAAGQSAYSVGCSHVDSWNVARVPEDMPSRRRRVYCAQEDKGRRGLAAAHLRPSPRESVLREAMAVRDGIPQRDVWLGPERSQPWSVGGAVIAAGRRCRVGVGRSRRRRAGFLLPRPHPGGSDRMVFGCRMWIRSSSTRRCSWKISKRKSYLVPRLWASRCSAWVGIRLHGSPRNCCRRC